MSNEPEAPPSEAEKCALYEIIHHELTGDLAQQVRTLRAYVAAEVARATAELQARFAFQRFGWTDCRERLADAITRAARAKGTL